MTHGRLRQITTVHPHDLSKSLGSLVRDEFLESHGMGRGTYYVIPGERPTTPFTAIDETEPVIIDSAEKSFSLSSQHLERLKDVAVLVRNKRKVSREQMISVILALCEGYYISSRELAELVQRAPDSLRNHYLNQLVAKGKLELMYPDKPSDPRQRYRTKAQTARSNTT